MGIKTYLADPYGSGQQGSNENTNGLLRRYLPKKTSFENLIQEDLEDIVFELNNRSRKVLQSTTSSGHFKNHYRLRVVDFGCKCRSKSG